MPISYGWAATAASGAALLAVIAARAARAITAARHAYQGRRLQLRSCTAIQGVVSNAEDMVQQGSGDAGGQESLPAPVCVCWPDMQQRWSRHPFHVHTPLHASYIDAPRNQQSSTADGGEPATCHPYKQVIEGLLQLPPHGGAEPEPPHEGDDSVTTPEPSLAPLPAPLDDSAWHLVQTPRELRALAAHLATVREFGLDLEHNASQSYLGITCLIQISTAAGDFLVDTLRLWSLVGPALRPVLSSPAVTKVVHGGANDVLWLQRDFSIFPVNIFDTQQAAMVLGMPSPSLAALLRSLCGVQLDKSLQRADWTARPLTPAMVAYARGDVHYLCHLAARLRAMLRAAGSPGPDPSTAPLATAVKRSQRLALQVYRPKVHAVEVAAAVAALVKRLLLDARDPPVSPQLAGAQLEALCCWRDITARIEDTSPGAVMPDGHLLALVTTQPASGQEAARLLRLHGMEAPQRQLLRLGDVLHRIMRGTAERMASDPVAAGAAAPTPVTCPTAPSSSVAAAARAKNKAQRTFADFPLERQRAIIDKFSCKPQSSKKVYSNCRMLSRSGELLAFCDQRKLEWYVSKGIAERVADDPPTIRLLFGHQQADQAAGEEFYKQSKANRCVACGTDDHYLRFRVVPACYRRHLPVALKSHRAHDVVLLCIPCHQLAQAAAEQTKRDISCHYGIPLVVNAGPSKGQAAEEAEEGEEDEPGGAGEDEDEGQEEAKDGSVTSSGPAKAPPTYTQARHAAQVLLHVSDKLPAARREELESTIRVVLGRAGAPSGSGLLLGELGAALLLGVGRRNRARALARLSPEEAGAAVALLDSTASHGGVRGHGGGHDVHGQRVVETALARGGEEELHALTARFRAAFVEACKPQFLPPSWSVQHRVARMHGPHSVFAANRLPPAPLVHPPETITQNGGG